MAAAIPPVTPLPASPSQALVAPLTADLLQEALGQELFRRVPEAELDAALSPLSTLDLTRVEELVPHLKTPNFYDPFFLETCWIEKVLYLSIQGHLTAHETAKLFLYRAVQEAIGGSSPEVLQIVGDDGSVDEAAWELLKTSMDNEYSELELDILIDDLKRLPPSETQFFAHHRTQGSFLNFLQSS